MTVADLSSLAVEVLHYRAADKHPGWLVGSGFFVSPRLVLTAWHTVDGPGELIVRVHGKEEYPAVVRLQGDQDIVDLAVLEVSDVAVEVPPIRYGVVDRSAPTMVERCWAIGFPHFKERAHDPKPLRLSAQVDGEIPTGENLDQPLLTLRVRNSPRPLPRGSVRESEWEGISGATVFSGNNILVGVITEHHLSEGESALTVVPITAIDLLPEAEATKWWELLGVDRQAFVRLPGDAHIDHPTTYLPPRNTLFQSRPGEFEHLETLLLPPDPAQRFGRVRLVGITGMGGIGKTQLAAEFAYRYQDRFPAGIFWMPGIGHTYADWQRQFADLALNTDYLPANDDISHPENEMRRARHFCRYLAGHADALLILDNVEDPGLLISVLPALAGGEIACSLLYTSRVTRVPAGFVHYQVKKLPQEAALRLLLHSTRPALLTEILSGSQGEEAQAAQTICKMVDNLPLALALLRSLLDIDRDMMLTALLAALQAQGVLEITEVTADVDPDAVSLIATFRLSWEKVKEAEAQRLFKLAAYFPEAAPIPLWLLGLATGLGEKTEGFTPLGKMWIRLQQLSLLEKLSKEQVSLHPLVREFGQRLVVMDGPEGKALVEEACERLVSTFTNLNALEQRANQQGYWECLQQVRATRGYAALLQAGQQPTALTQVERWLDRESYLLADGTLWPEKLPGLFYQQLFNHSVEVGQPLKASQAPAKWVRQMMPVGREEDQDLVRIFAGHTSTVNSVAFSPDGTQVLTGSSDRTARLWEAKSGSVLHVLEGHTGYVESVAFSPDGTQVLTGSEDGTARLWEIATGKELVRFQQGHTRGSVRSVAFSPDGTQVLTGSSDKTARLWDAQSGVLLQIFGVRWYSDRVESVAFSPDGTQVLTGTWYKTAQLWDAQSGSLLHTLEGHWDWVVSVAFSPDGSLLLTGSWDGTARLWDAKSGSLLRALQGHTATVNSVTFSPDGRQVLIGLEDGAACLWEVATGQELMRFQGNRFRIHSVAFSPDGRQALTGSSSAACLWDVASGQELMHFLGTPAFMNSVAFSPDGCQVLTGSMDGIACLWDVASDKELMRFRGHTGGINSVAFSPDGRQVLTGSGDGTARLWDVASGKEPVRFQDIAWISSVAFSPDGRQVLISRNDGTTRLWDMVSGQALVSFQTQYYFTRLANQRAKWVTNAVFSPDGRQVLTVSTNGAARLWDVATGQELFFPSRRRRSLGEVATDQELRFLVETEVMRSVVFSPDGRRVLTDSTDKTAHLWDVATGQELVCFQGDMVHVNCVAFSPDGRQVLTGLGDTIAGWLGPTGPSSARLWDVESGQELVRFQGHLGWINSVAFSPDGRQVLTGSEDGTARLWEVATGQELVRFQGITPGDIRYVAFSPDGHLIVTYGSGHIYFWQGTPPDMGRLVGMYAPITDIEAVHWWDARHIMLAGTGGLSGYLYFYVLALEGM